LVLVNLRTGERRGVVEYSEPDPKARRHRQVALSPDERTLAVSEWPDKVLLFDVPTAKRIDTLAGGDERPVTALAFSPDSKTLAVAYSANESPRENEVIAWDWGHHQRRWDAMMVTASGSLAFSPDGRWLAAGQDAHDVPVWNAETGHIRACPWARPAARRLSHVAFGGQFLAASWQGDGNGTAGVILWDTRTWKMQQFLTNDQHDVWALAVSRDGRQLAVADVSKALHIKQTPPLRDQ
jgi:WD40 repeat protein